MVQQNPSLFEIIGDALPSDKVRELLQLSNNNPDSREDRAKDLAAYMLLPVGSYSHKYDDMQIGEIILKMDAEKVELRVKQMNSDITHEWARKDVFRRADEIADEVERQ